MVIQVTQNNVVDIRAQMAHGGIQQMQVILHTAGFQAGTGGGVQLGALSAEGQVDLIHIFHQFQGRLFTDVLIQGAAKVIGDVVFAVGKGACAAEAAHNGAIFAVDAGFDLVSVNGTAALFQLVAHFKHSDLQLRSFFQQLIGCENTAGACAHDQYIVHIIYLLKSKKVDYRCGSQPVWKFCTLPGVQIYT